MFSINVSYDMIDNILISPVILEDHMIGQNYLEFLQNIPKALLENIPLAT